MKIIKPLRLGLLTRTFEDGPRSYLVVSAMTFFPFPAPGHLLPDVALWKLVARELGGEGILDEGMPKSNGELIVHGNAYPRVAPAPSTHVRVSLGPVNKTLYVFGQRWFKTGGIQSDPEPFTRMPLGWKNAFGGPEYEGNPAGKGHRRIKTESGEVHPLPNVEDPRHLITSPGDRPEPAGFGAHDPSRPQRRVHAGTYDRRWLEDRYPGYPEDFHWDFFNVAPRDQHIDGFFRGGEAFRIENMHPSRPVIEGTLPGLGVRCFVNLDRPGGPSLREVKTKVDTVVLFPHEERGIVIHRGVVEVAEDDARDVLQIVAAVERAGESRPVEHYARVLADRLDRAKPFSFVLDRDLLPEPDPSSAAAGELPDDRLSDMESLLARDGLLEANARRGAQRRLEETRAEMIRHGLDPSMVPSELPPPRPVPTLEEAPEFAEQMKEEAERRKQEADTMRAQAEQEARRLCARSGVDYDKIVAERQAQGARRPPRFLARVEMERLTDMKTLADNAGAALPEIELKLADPAFAKKLIEVEQHLFDALRRFAHHMPPPEDNATNVREEVERLRRSRSEAGAVPHGESRSFAGFDLTDADLSGLDLSGMDFEEAILERANLAGADLSGANLASALLTRANLASARLKGARLGGANLGLTDLSSADVSEADLRDAVLAKANLRGATFENTELTGADLFEATIEDVSFASVKAPGARFIRATLRRVSFSRASLTKACFIEATLEDVDFAGAALGSAVFFGTRGERVRFAGAHLENVRFVNDASFPGADLSGARAAGANLRGGHFSKAIFKGAVLDGADLSECDLSGADLEGASARDALLLRTDLRDANLEGADLMQALLQKARVDGARLQRANLFRADAAKMRGDSATDLSGANVKHVRFVPDRRRNG